MGVDTVCERCGRYPGFCVCGSLDARAEEMLEALKRIAAALERITVNYEGELIKRHR